jgi:signal transduction histidine kinase
MSQQDPFYLIAEATAAEVGEDFLAALVRSMREAMDVSVAAVTRGIGEPPARARASLCWKKAGSSFPDEYEVEGTPCEFVYMGQTLVVPKQLALAFPRERALESYCGVPLHNGSNRVVGHIFVVSETPIRNAARVEGIMRIFGMRAQAELQRIEAEQKRASLIERLNHAIERLSHQHQLTKEANAFKTDALGMVAHDLRSPLAAILSRAELIEQLLIKHEGSGKDADPNALRAKLITCCDSIGRSADRMEQMIAGLLASARSEARTISLRCADVDLAEPVHVAIGLNQRAAEAKDIRISEMFTDAGPIVADADRLIEAVDNLISNAIKYSAPGGTVAMEVGIDRVTRLAWISVTDNGQGMSEADIALAFQRFQKLSAKPTGGESSTGLGLAIVKAIAEAHGGSVEASSPGKGLGSTFTLRLPLEGPPGSLT